MTRVIAIIAFTASLALGGAAEAQELPQWNLRVTCAKETDPACRAFEANAYSRLSGEWRSMPARARKACLDDARSFGHTSYRLLELCLDSEPARRPETETLAERPRAEDLGSPAWVSDGLRLLFRR